MRFIFAFSAEPLQLRFLNWILDRDDIDKNVMMEAVRNKDSQFVDGISEFTKFQSEAKKYANKIGNSSNIFLDCIYDRCANDDDSFKYMFGEDNDKTRYVKCYGHILNELYDAFVNSEEFSKEGRFMQRAKEVFNGFKGKKTTLEQLVKDMNQILVDNNKNSGNEDDDDGRTFEQKEEDSWKVLEDNEEYSHGEWHVYRVDKYEDMRNVAGRCSEWCVARADSGRSHFYGTYNPPYYLFCKGKRNPWILMHIPTQQFKGLDDEKFEPDRPTSYEAIEIGRDFLDSMGELRSYYDEDEDFSVFNDDDEFDEEPELDDRNIIDGSSDEELSRMLDNTDNPYKILEIVDTTSDYDVIMKGLDKCNVHVPFGDIAKVIIKKDILQLVGPSRSIAIYDRILDECDERYRDLKRRTLGIILAYVDDIGVVSHIIGKYCNGDEIAGIIYDVLYKSCSPAIIEWMLSHGMAETAKDIMLKVNNKDLFSNILVNHADDVELVGWLIENCHLDEEVMVPLAKKTTSMEIIRLLAEKSYENRLEWNGEVASILWRKTNGNRKVEELLFKSYPKKSEETANLMLSKATTKEEKCAALKSGASHDEIIKCFDEVIDGMKWEGQRVGNDYHMFVLFRKEIDDRARLEKLFEKVGYDLGIVCYAPNSMSPTVDDVIKAVSTLPSLTQAQVASALKTIVVEGRHEILPTDKNRMLMKELLKKYNEDNVLANTIIGYSDDIEFVKWVIENHEASCHSIYKWMEYDRKRQTPGMIRRLADAVKAEKDARMIPTVISLPGCPKDVIEMFRNETRNGRGYGDDSMYAMNEFRRGLLDDPDGFFEEYCRKNANYETRIWKLMGQCEENGKVLSRCIDLLLGYDFVPESVKKEVAKFILHDDSIMGFDGGSQTIGGMIDWCIEHEVLESEILCAKSATEEQIRKVVEDTIDSIDYVDTVDKAVSDMTPLAKKVVSEYEENGDIDVNWEDLILNPESTSEDLSKAVDYIEENNPHPEKEVETLLNHKNCTKDIAERALKLIDFDKYVDEGNYLEVILKWTGAGILSMKDGNGYGASSCIRSYNDLSLVAQKARSEQELDDVLEYSGKIADGDNDDEEEDEESNYKFTTMLRSVYRNSACSLEYFERMLDEYSGYLSAEEDLPTYVDAHMSTLSSEDIDRICEKYDKLLMDDEEIVGNLEKCVNATEEQLLNLISKYNAVGNLVQMRHALGNDNTTERVILDMMELVDDDDVMNEIVSSKKATEAVYRKAAEMRLGTQSLETAMKNTSDKGLSDRIRAMLEDKSTKYGLASQINEENDIDRLKTLVIRMYRMSLHDSDSVYSSSSLIRDVSNPRALELMSKTKNKKILASVVRNPYTPEKTVLQILKKSQSNDIVTAATYRIEKSILLYAGCVTKNQEDIDRIFKWKERMRMFNSEDIMKMMKWNPSCKFDILKRVYFKLSNEQLLSLKKLQDKDVDWIVDAILKNDEHDEKEAKAGRIVHKMLKASRIIRKLLTD